MGFNSGFKGLMRTDRRTDRHDKANASFSQFRESAYKVLLTINKKCKHTIKYLIKM